MTSYTDDWESKLNALVGFTKTPPIAPPVIKPPSKPQPIALKRDDRPAVCTQDVGFQISLLGEYVNPYKGRPMCEMLQYLPMEEEYCLLKTAKRSNQQRDYLGQFWMTDEEINQNRKVIIRR